MNTYYVTFGQKYRYEEHPVGLYIHPDGYVAINANDMEEARRIAFETFGDKWAFMYEEDNFKKHYFPRGLLSIVGEQTTYLKREEEKKDRYAERYGKQVESFVDLETTNETK